MEIAKVRDLMVTLDDYTTVPEEATLSDAVAALEHALAESEVRGYPHRAVLVLDRSGRVVGKLGQLDVLRSLEPRYAEMGDLKRLCGFGVSAEFLRSMIGWYELWQAPVDEVCRMAAGRRVGDLVASPLEGEFIDADAPLSLAIHQLIMGHHQSLLATSQGEVVGILKLTDLFREVSRLMGGGDPGEG